MNYYYFNTLFFSPFSFYITEEIHADMISKGLISILAQMTRLTFGNTNMQKLCLHSLVRLISGLDNEGDRSALSFSLYYTYILVRIIEVFYQRILFLVY